MHTQQSAMCEQRSTHRVLTAEPSLPSQMKIKHKITGLLTGSTHIHIGCRKYGREHTTAWLKVQGMAYTAIVLLWRQEEHTLPPRCSRTRASKDSKMSMEGWWMVTMTVRPFRDTFLMLCMTMAAAPQRPALQQSRLQRP